MAKELSFVEALNGTTHISGSDLVAQLRGGAVHRGIHLSRLHVANSGMTTRSAPAFICKLCIILFSVNNLRVLQIVTEHEDKPIANSSGTFHRLVPSPFPPSSSASLTWHGSHHMTSLVLIHFPDFYAPS